MFDDLFNNDAFMLGANILANNTGHYGAFAPAVGGGVQSWAQQKPDMMETAEKQAQLQHLEEYIKTLPEEQQALFRAYPSLAEKMFENQLGMGDRYGSTFYAENPQDGNRFWIYQLQKGGPPIPLMPADPKHNLSNFGTHYGYTNPYAPSAPPVIPGMSQPAPQSGPVPQPGYAPPPPVAPSTGQPGPQPMMYQQGSSFDRAASAPSMGPASSAPVMGQYGSAGINPPPEQMPAFKAAQTRAVETAKGETAREQKDINERGANTTKLRAQMMQNDIVLNTMDKIENNINKWTTGPGGTLASAIPYSDARLLRDQIKTLVANLGFDKLQQMKESSPTGGALGAINKSELEFLQSVAGTLNPNQPEEMLRVLNQVRKLYKRMLYDVTEGYESKYGEGSAEDPFNEASTPGASGGTDFRDLSTEEIQRMLDEGRYR